MHVKKAARNIKEIDSPWDQRALKKFWNGLSLQRRIKDKKFLRNLFKRARKYPWLAKELTWAKKHGIKFIVDRAVNLSGYYTSETGVIAIAYKGKKGAYLETLGHEIRHAFQEYKGLLYMKPGVLKRIVNEALLEADATAAEPMALQRKRRFNAREILLRHFKGWYSSKNPEIYCKVISRLYADVYKGRKREEGRAEFCPVDTVCSVKQKGIFDAAGFKKLGETFNGLNYLDTPEAYHFLEKVTDPVLASKFFNPDRKEMDPDLQIALDYEDQHLGLHRNTFL